MNKGNLTQEQLKSMYVYDKDTGIFIRARDLGNCYKAGQIAGGSHNSGYTVIRFGKRLYLAHRLAWLYVYGEWPKLHIDHINGIKTDNRISNLRDVTASENMANQHRARSDSVSGVLGVSCSCSRKGWRAQICRSGKVKNLGTFNTKEAAQEAYWNARNEHYKPTTKET